MRFFLRSRKFKIFAVSVVILAIAVIAVGVLSTVSSPLSSLIGTVTVPAENFLTGVSDKINSYKLKLSENDELIERIAELEKENNELIEKLSEYEETANQNKFYEEFLGIKEKDEEMLFQSATVTSRDQTDPYKGFTINVGIMDGIHRNDPVICADGLVGIVSEVAPTYSKVTTVLSPEMKAGGEDNRTLDEGIISGRVDLAEKGQCYLYNLHRDCTVSVGDNIVTSGGSVFPSGLIVGKVTDIKQQTKDTSLYAVVDVAANIDELREVMVITYYSGKGLSGLKGDTK